MNARNVGCTVGGCFLLIMVAVIGTGADYKCPTPKEHQICAVSYGPSCEPGYFPGYPGLVRCVKKECPATKWKECDGPATSDTTCEINDTLVGCTWTLFNWQQTTNNGCICTAEVLDSKVNSSPCRDAWNTTNKCSSPE